MSDYKVLEVRFHFNGDFVIDGSKVKCCNGDWGLSHIDKDKLSIPELQLSKDILGCTVSHLMQK